MKPILVAGLGNPLMGDEGIGPRVIEALLREADRFPDVEFVDLGAGGMAALHAMAGRRRAVFVDCARMGELPGTIRRFTAREVRSRKDLPGVSLHESDLLAVIGLSRRLGECPEETVIFGIEPVDISAGKGLSPALREGLARYTAAVAAELG